jgi:hypothetical protein
MAAEPKSRADRSSARRGLLCVSPSFSPDTTPTAIRATKLLERLRADWDLTVLTEGQGQRPSEHLSVEVVRPWRPRRLLAGLRRLRQAKLLELAVWPDASIFWLLPAILAGRRVIRQTRPSAIVVFMMPYSAGLVGLGLSRIAGLPLILNLDDSPTCTDMHPGFPTRLHYRLAKALEDFYVRHADAVVYVSRTNLHLVGARQPTGAQRKLHLVRYGAEETALRAAPAGRNFKIVYVGAMSGWWSLVEHPPARRLERLYDAWAQLGRYELTRLDHRTSSPAIIGKAILDAIAEHPDWDGRVNLSVYGNPYPDALIERALSSAGVQSAVSVFGPVPHAQITDIILTADLLFLTLPKRLDGSPGGRISAKTYEYLMTDRPILAAVSPGENWTYLEDKPGVWLVAPDDRDGMKRVIDELAEAKFAGAPQTFDRSALRKELSYAKRAEQFAAVVLETIDSG